MKKAKTTRPKQVSPEDVGSLKVYKGPMFSRKTTEAAAERERYLLAKKRVLSVKPQIDTRHRGPYIKTHEGKRIRAVIMKRGRETLTELRRLAPKPLGSYSLIFFDEGQFFTKRLVRLVRELREMGINVIVAGLDLDRFGKPFGPMGDLMCHATEVIECTGVCMDCKNPHKPGTRTLGPSNTNQTVVIGGKELYRVVCDNCYVKAMGRL